MALSRKSLRFSSGLAPSVTQSTISTHCGIGSGKLGDMPVAAIHAAVDAKCLDGVEDVGFELLACPVLVIGLSRDAGNLAVDIRHRGQLFQFCRHGSKMPALMPGLPMWSSTKRTSGHCRTILITLGI